ncbi:DUF4249 domain-containing protein [Flavivirga rizhaonensis]|uniref:DUF4249 domain-containing protein n=1 Tax=Flavivirga rizhaonensis TaxID=2559571 RepID=A0A4S1DSL3_9FLAO|nr:DUF4249 domain-containing protein [Flavivirga rizhaonensis]TGV00961.1 DUF4249 domain-containing protein [Flavivirga rizhaonensis]
MFRKIKCLFVFLSFLSLTLHTSCTDPVVPEYEYKEGLVYVDAYVSTAVGGSYVLITETSFLSGNLVDLFVKNATVSYRNVETNNEVFLTESDKVYVPPNDFFASVDEIWELSIKFSDGRVYKSKPETIIAPVGFSNLKATYNSELLYRESEKAFLPGHFVSLDLDDPGADKNYYFWKFRSFEKLEFCEQCPERIFRDGKCVASPVSLLKNKLMSYGCDTDCWEIRYNEDITIFSDDFTNGVLVQGLPVGNVILYTKNNIVVEMQQFSLSPSAYKYYKVLKDIVDNNGGFNAPPPAALIGNMFNPNDSNEFVLGRFTAASAVVKSVFIDRSQIEDTPVLRDRGSVFYERCRDICLPSECELVPPPDRCNPITSVSCEESRFRTGIRPEGWID